MFSCCEPREIVRKARTKQPTTRTYARLSALSKRMANAVHVDIYHGLSTFKKKVSASKLEEAYKSKSYGEIMAVIPWDDMYEDLDPAWQKLHGNFLEAAKLTVPSLPTPMKREMRFDTKNPNIKRYLDRQTGTLIVNIKQNTLDIVQAAVQRSFTQALSPKRVADQIKGSIGLYPRQEVALYNYTRGLQESGVKPEKILTLSSKYEDRLLNQRAMTIARTETRFATNNGQLSIWKQGANEGYINRNKAKKVWIVDGDPCPICEPMDGVAVGLDEMWILETGDICDVPTDSHPNCFCGMELDFGDEE